MAAICGQNLATGGPRWAFCGLARYSQPLGHSKIVHQHSKIALAARNGLVLTTTWSDFAQKWPVVGHSCFCGSNPGWS